MPRPGGRAEESTGAPAAVLRTEESRQGGGAQRDLTKRLWNMALPQLHPKILTVSLNLRPQSVWAETVLASNHTRVHYRDCPLEKSKDIGPSVPSLGFCYHGSLKFLVDVGLLLLRLFNGSCTMRLLTSLQSMFPDKTYCKGNHVGIKASLRMQKLCARP